MKKQCECGSTENLKPIYENEQIIGYICQKCYDKEMERQAATPEGEDGIPLTVPEYIQQQLDNLDQATQLVRDQIHRISSRKAAEITGIDQAVLSSFAHGNRKFSYKRLLEIAEKIF